MAITKQKVRAIVSLIVAGIAGYFAWKKWGPKIDSTGARWTVSGGKLLRNGIDSGGRTSDNSLWIQNGVAFTTGTDGHPYQYIGSAWVWVA